MPKLALASRLILGVALVSVVAAPRLTMAQTCTSQVFGNINVGDGSTPLDPNGAVVGWRDQNLSSCTFGCPGRNWGSTFVSLPYNGTYVFSGQAAFYLGTPWQAGASCQFVSPSCSNQCSGSFNLTLYAAYGNFVGSVYQFPKGVPVVDRRVHSDHTLQGGPLTDSQGLYNWATWGGAQQLQNNWGIRVSGDGSGPGYGTYELSVVAYDPAIPYGTVVATTQSSKATRVDFSLWDAGFEQPNRCEDPSSNSGPGSGEVSTSTPAEPQADLPVCPVCDVGLPVSVTTGAVHLDQTDVTLPGVGPGLRFVRSYNSQLRAPGQYGIFGPGWNHGYEQRLTIFSSAPNIIMLRKANGNAAYFQDNGGDLTYEPSVPFTKASKIVKQADGTFIRYFRRGGSETYSSSGLLTGLTDPSGNTVTLTRSSGQLTTITEIGGRSLTLGYVGGLVNTLSGPSGLIATFGYNAGRLASVAYADGSGYTYTYDGLTNQLLTVGDLTGRTLETHTYYGDGRAKTSQIAAGKELQTLVYTNPLRTTVTDALNNVTTYDFSMIWGSLHVTKITGPCASCGGGGETQEWTYDDRGRVLSYKDGEGNVRSYTYTTADGDLETETRSPEPGVTHLTRYEYQSDGRLFRRTDPNLKTTTWTLYVPAGPQTVTEKVSATENRVTGLVYWPQGQLHFLTDPRGKVWEFSFFPVGDLQSVKDPFGNTTSFEYDPMGRRTQTILPLTTPPTQPTVTTYNIRGQVRLITNPNASYTQFTYDKGGRRETVRDALAHVTTYGYDPYGRLETITYLGTNQVARFVYDDMSHLRSLTDGRLKTTQFVPDAYGRVETVTYADLRSEGFTYYLTGRVKTHTDRNGIVTTFTYDGLGRVKGKTYTTTAGATVMPPTTFRYDENGYIGSMTTAANDTDTLTWTYDLAKQMMSETSVRNQSTVSYTYDPAGNRKTLTVGSLDLIYDYNDAGRLSMIHRGANTFTFGYDEASRRRTLTYPNGAETTYTPDELSRLGEVKANVAASLIARAAYTYDDISNRRTKTTEAFAEVYTPDDWNRLAQVTRGGTPTEGYSYDAVGNRQIGGYSDTNRLENKGFTTFGYDENGNLSSKTACGGPCDIPWYYAWNAENQLIGVGQEEPTMLQFSYDPLGRRVRTLMGAVTTTFVYDGEDILRQTRSNGAVVLGTLWYIHGPGIDEPLGQEDDTGLSYFHADGLGSIVKTTNSAGSVTSSRQYNSFGNLQLDASSGYAFTGREWDSEVGLYYYRARYYDPKLGRFLNEDPIGFEGGDVNLYAYVWNNPTNFIDPEGLAGLNISCGPEPQPPPPGAGTLSWFWFNLQHDSWLSCMNMTPIRAMLSLPTPAACLQAPVAGVITGFTKHGLNSAISHPGGGTSPAAMLRAVRNPAGGIPQAGGTIKYVGPDATVIVNQQGKVVTTWPTAASGARCAPCQ